MEEQIGKTNKLIKFSLLACMQIQKQDGAARSTYCVWMFTSYLVWVQQHVNVFSGWILSEYENNVWHYVLLYVYNKDQGSARVLTKRNRSETNTKRELEAKYILVNYVCSAIRSDISIMVHSDGVLFPEGFSAICVFLQWIKHWKVFQ